jgi:hypothetical protein
MTEFNAVAAARFSPTKCALCDTHMGPFIDTGWELLGYGHVYICMAGDGRSGCVRQMSRLDGMIDVEVVNTALEELDVLRAKTDQLEKELLEVKVVPMQEVLDELRRQRGGRPAKPKTVEPTLEEERV